MQVAKPANIKRYTSNNSSDMPKEAFQIVLTSDLIFFIPLELHLYLRNLVGYGNIP